ncbi:MAG: hypothetical protein H8D78_01570, partial [Chloroflexi bacterium]|nr:hypothetical protein [Chloroflexota bacterium]
MTGASVPIYQCTNLPLYRPAGAKLMMNNDIIVETHDLTKVYGDGAEVRALD